MSGAEHSIFWDTAAAGGGSRGSHRLGQRALEREASLYVSTKHNKELVAERATSLVNAVSNGDLSEVKSLLAQHASYVGRGSKSHVFSPAGECCPTLRGFFWETANTPQEQHQHQHQQHDLYKDPYSGGGLPPYSWVDMSTAECIREAFYVEKETPNNSKNYGNQIKRLKRASLEDVLDEDPRSRSSSLSTTTSQSLQPYDFIPPLHIAAEAGYMSIALELLAHGASINKRCYVEGIHRTPLHYACAGGNLAIAAVLLDAGALALPSNASLQRRLDDDGRSARGQDVEATLRETQEVVSGENHRNTAEIRIPHAITNLLCSWLGCCDGDEGAHYTTNFQELACSSVRTNTTACRAATTRVNGSAVADGSGSTPLHTAIERGDNALCLLLLCGENEERNNAADEHHSESGSPLSAAAVKRGRRLARQFNNVSRQREAAGQVSNIADDLEDVDMRGQSHLFSALRNGISFDVVWSLLTHPMRPADPHFTVDEVTLLSRWHLYFLHTQCSSFSLSLSTSPPSSCPPSASSLATRRHLPVCDCVCGNNPLPPSHPASRAPPLDEKDALLRGNSIHARAKALASHVQVLIRRLTRDVPISEQRSKRSYALPAIEHTVLVHVDREEDDFDYDYDVSAGEGERRRRRTFVVAANHRVLEEYEEEDQGRHFVGGGLGLEVFDDEYGDDEDSIAFLLKSKVYTIWSEFFSSLRSSPSSAFSTSCSHLSSSCYCYRTARELEALFCAEEQHRQQREGDEDHYTCRSGAEAERLGSSDESFGCGSGSVETSGSGAVHATPTATQRLLLFSLTSFVSGDTCLHLASVAATATCTGRPFTSNIGGLVKNLPIYLSTLAATPRDTNNNTDNTPTGRVGEGQGQGQGDEDSIGSDSFMALLAELSDSDKIFYSLLLFGHAPIHGGGGCMVDIRMSAPCSGAPPCIWRDDPSHHIILRINRQTGMTAVHNAVYVYVRSVALHGRATTLHHRGEEDEVVAAEVCLLRMLGYLLGMRLFHGLVGLLTAENNNLRDRVVLYASAPTLLSLPSPPPVDLWAGAKDASGHTPFSLLLSTDDSLCLNIATVISQAIL